MIFQRLRVFVSSKMYELAEERRALKTALEGLKVDAWLFEEDAGARPESIQKAFLEEVEAADLYVGLFWKGYGEYTIAEFNHARRLHKDCLVYEKLAGPGGERDHRLELFLGRLGDVENGLTIKRFTTTEELSEAVANDVAKWQKRKIDERQNARVSITLTRAEKKDRDEQLILLREVKEFWIEGVLERSLHEHGIIDLGKEEWLNTNEQPWERIVELPDQTSHIALPDYAIGQLFDDTNSSLLIVGAPGAGKTITLLDLARDLIGRAEDDPSRPIPVVFNLSTWSGQKHDLRDWLVSELWTKYRVPKTTSQKWLADKWLLPLLDGLDEVAPDHRRESVEAINAYMQSHGVPGIAVCSRLTEYTDLPVRLDVGGAIRLQPLRSEQVKDYVARAGESLAGLNAALENDPVLQGLAETPLMLDVMSVAYRHVPATALTSDSLDTEPARRGHVFDTYVSRMLDRKGTGAKTYTPERTVEYLARFARRMQQHGQTLLLIEHLQPSWLTTASQRAAYIVVSRLVFGLLFGLAYAVTVGVLAGLIEGLILGLIPGLIDLWRFRKRHVAAGAATLRHSITVFLIYACAIGLGEGLFYGALNGRRGGIIVGLIYGLLGGVTWGTRNRLRHLENDIQVVEALRWSAARARKGLAIGLLIGLLFAVVRAPIQGWVAGLTDGLIFAVIGLFFGALKGGSIDAKAVPNRGTQLSIRNALLASGLALLVYGLFGVLYFGLRNQPGEAILLILRGGVILALIAAFWYGGQDVVHHYTLRSIVAAAGDIPFGCAAFLDYAARLVFTQKVGGGYMFIHRLLLEHFAAMKAGSETAQRLDSRLRHAL